MNSNIAPRANSDLLESKYADWKRESRSVEPTWASFFEGFELGMAQPPRVDGAYPVSGGGPDPSWRNRLVSMISNFRRLGHQGARINPLSKEAPEVPQLTLEALGFAPGDLDEEITSPFYDDGRTMPLREMIDRLRMTYCDKLGFEFMHIPRREVREWIRERIESRIDLPKPDAAAKKEALTALVHAEGFERFLHRKYVGQKRFSLEGGESLMVALDTILQRCPAEGVSEIFMGMAHRGRLNVLANLLHKPLKVLLYEFSENYVPNLVAGDGDVKYHLGFDGVRRTRDGHEVGLHLASNPSHLEAVNGVVEGKARARQRALDPEMRDQGVDRRPVLPILIHGDAAFAGQGSVAEILNASQLPGYRTGGTIHIIINNQIGFTTSPADARSSQYCTDVAKMIDGPVVHVNGDSPMDVVFAAQMALEYRQKFQSDFFIDIVCYRRHGHNEGDEPAFTQPKLYRDVNAQPTTAALFKKELVKNGDLTREDASAIAKEYRKQLNDELSELEEAERRGEGHALGGSLAQPQPAYSHDPVPTGVPDGVLRKIGHHISKYPENFDLNEKIAKRFLLPRQRAVEAGKPFNWALAESLAFGSLLLEGLPVRLSGQDCRRGTFSHRHVVLYDAVTRERYTPLNHIERDQKAKLWVYNSLLSEFAVLGFEYGYSSQATDMLVLWEAQFGDFANGAQVIIDQFIASAESKWQRPSDLVMLLPHGYEGQGPEHSSARLERFLQLCAGNNMQVCNLTTPAQYFHVLRRQMHRPAVDKPLVLMTPKSLLTHPECVSQLEDMAEGTCFHEVIDDPFLPGEEIDRVDRLIFCAGKVYYDLIKHRRENEIPHTAIIRTEQMYPFHYERVSEIAQRYPENAKWVWCQEEPMNMGAWTFIAPRLQKLTPHRIRYAGREPASSPAVGSKAIHKREQSSLVEMAFNV